MDTEKRDIPFFTKLYTIAQILGILTVVLVGVWCGSYRQGFAWSSDPNLQFNWHPFLMTLGMVFLYANGALIYRGFRYEKKKKLKIIHMLVMLSSFILSIIGLVAVFDFHNASAIPNMYSLHSWMGIITVLLFSFQWVAGFLTFLFPGLRVSVRAAYMPVHQFFGLFIFVSAVATSLIGLTEKAFFVLKGTTKYKDLPDEGVLINITGLSFIIFAGLVVYLTTTPAYKRQTTEDEVLLTDTVLE